MAMRNMKTFTEYLDKIRPEVNEHIKAIAEAKLKDLDVIPVLLKGKRLRAGLLMLMFDSISAISDKSDPLLFQLFRQIVTAADRNKALDLACAIELAHSASLILDDMLDKDTERRGLPTIHLKRGHKQAMLDSVGVLSIPYDIIAKYGSNYVEMLADTQRSMVSGVIRELFHKPDLPALKLYDAVITQKTGRLFELATWWGCMAADEQKVVRYQLFSDYGLHCGKAMQIADDIADLNKIIEGKKTGGFGSEMLLLKCMTADRLVKEFIKDVKNRSLQPSKLKEFMTNSGVNKTLNDLLQKEIDEARWCVLKANIPHFKCHEPLMRAPTEIAGMMIKEV